jgi:hypothetical protein
MTTFPPSHAALATPEAISEVADCFASIAESLHHTLRSLSDQVNVSSSEKLYALITEEYGLRTRLGILRGDAKNRVVKGVEFSQADLVSLLRLTSAFIRQSKSVDEIAFVVNSTSVLCVSVFPGKQQTIDFLVGRLKFEIGAT